MPESRVRATTPWLVKNVINPIMLLTGGFPTVTVNGRRTGKPYRTPINVVEMPGGELYLVSPRGETTWSRNLRETGVCVLKLRGQERQYRASEVDPAARPPIIAAYLQRWGSQTGKDFEKLPDPLDHPTFRLEPVA
jgi:deazaflavin-dependent oxidoreductase (nitroreductase family)